MGSPHMGAANHGTIPRATGHDAIELSPEEIHALRRAGQNQLTRWSRHGLQPDERERRDALRAALYKLKRFKDGCDLQDVARQG